MKLDKLLTGALQRMMGGQQKQDRLLQIISTRVSNQGSSGGLAGLIQQFQQAGLGEQAQSWVGRGQNMPISVEQLMQVFGAGNLKQTAAASGLDEQDFGGRLAEMLPRAVVQMTPEGSIPAGGVDDALDMLSKLMPH